MSDIAFASAVELAKRIRAKEIGCLELLELYLGRVHRLNAQLNAIIVLDEEKAIARARAADTALAKDEVWGPLHGVPMTIKESFDVEGTPTTWGVPELKGNIASRDAVAVERLRTAGVTLFGKTNVPFMLGDWQSFNAIYGTTNNPWDVTRVPGGSSGGSAAALAAGLTGIDAGSDIGASIRNPAHYCGVFGHKPTYGILPPRGQSLPGIVTPQDISVIGPLARSADDLEVAMDAMAGPDILDAECWKLDLPASRKKRLQDFRVGVMLTDPNCAQDQELTDQLQGVVDALAKAGVQVDETARPDIDTTEAHRVYLMLLRAATGARMAEPLFQGHLRRAQGADEADTSYKTMVDRAVTQYHRDWLEVEETQNQMRLRWHTFFQEYDLLLTPIAASAAFVHDQAGDRADRTIPINGKEESVVDQLFWAGWPGAFYLPATVAPAGLTRSGLPCGLQIIAAHGHDRTAIHFARLMEQEIGGFVAPEGYS
ncbi:MAG: amidase [Rhodospirillaceae bacterium]|jgi:amidase|nr:amidase [Rhodospirillaceae bacterium]